MELSTKVRYGTRAMLELAFAGRGHTVSLKEISAKQRISANYLAQIFMSLRKAGLVVSVRGPAGGFSLGREPERISIGDIVKALKERISVVYCLEHDKTRRACPLARSCVTRLLWQRLKDRIQEIVDQTTLEDLRKEAANTKRPAPAERPCHNYVFNI